MAKRGHPTRYTKKLAAALCAEIAQGKSLRTVCAPDKMPSVATVFNWFAVYPDFLEQYARAKTAAADAFAEDILDIADDATNDYMEEMDKEGEVIGYKVMGEAVQRSKLRVDTRKWLAMKLKPKVYGERVDITSGDEPLQPIAIYDMTPDGPVKKGEVAAPIKVTPKKRKSVAKSKQKRTRGAVAKKKPVKKGE